MKIEQVLGRYLSKQVTPLFDDPINRPCPDLIVVVPCHNEPDVLPSMRSLARTASHDIRILMIIVVNHGSNADGKIIAQNEKTIQAILEWNRKNGDNKSFTVKPITAFDLPPKKAGVGLARKIGMDEACRIYAHFQKDGVVACFDADSLCDLNYSQAILKRFENNERLDAVSIHFEHPISGDEYDGAIYESIVQYELHLRYFIEEQRKLSLPFAYHTVGSSMAVKAGAYARFGGMNQRKAGEDFYFLQKFIENGKVANLGTTKVIPSPRTSDRVPFGTGKAINDMLNDSGPPTYFTYSPKSFQVLKPFIDSIPDLYASKTEDIITSYPKEVKTYFEHINFLEKIEESKSNTSSFERFRNRLFKHFNAFQLMKYLHFARDLYYPNLPIKDAVAISKGDDSIDLIEELKVLREKQRSYNV